MRQIHSRLVQGTLILTAAGFLSRIMGFFFRIFLSRSFGEENVGLYQLAFPVYAFCFALGTSGFETALSRTTARMVSLNKKREANYALYAALGLSLSISIFFTLALQRCAKPIASTFLKDVRCTELLLILAFALPFSAFHSCICGRSYGLQKSKMPAYSQLIEQTVRILSVVTLYFLLGNTERGPKIQIAAAGIVLGEFAAALYSSRFLPSLPRKTPGQGHLASCKKPGQELLRLGIPLTANRTIVTLLQGIEAVSIPACLTLYCKNPSEALGTYGVLTGMALPCILFPSAITSSLSVCLLPAVAEKQADKQTSSTIRLVQKAAGSCFILGLFCCIFFLFTGSFIGNVLFKSNAAGNFILTLAWICPFLYTNSALLSSINGLGHTFTSLLINCFGLSIRIAGIYLAIPRFGIQGYLLGMLVSQVAVSISTIAVLCHFCRTDSRANRTK